MWDGRRSEIGSRIKIELSEQLNFKLVVWVFYFGFLFGVFYEDILEKNDDYHHNGGWRGSPGEIS